jgi:hypothetical protein
MHGVYSEVGTDPLHILINVLCCYIMALTVMYIVLTTASLLHSADPHISMNSSTSSLAHMLQTHDTQLPHAPLEPSAY